VQTKCNVTRKNYGMASSNFLSFITKADDDTIRRSIINKFVVYEIMKEKFVWTGFPEFKLGIQG